MNVSFNRELIGMNGGSLFIKSFKQFSKNDVTTIKDSEVVIFLDFNLKDILNAIKYKLRGKKIILYCLGKRSYDQNKIIRKIALKVFDEFIAITNKFSFELFNKRVNVIQNGIDFSIFKNMHLKRENLHLCVGFIRPIKNQMYVVDKAITDINNIFHLIGEVKDKKYYEELGYYIGMYKLTNINFLGEISQKELAKQYNLAKKVYISSDFEVFTSIILESIACGVPSIEISEGAKRFMDYDIDYIKKNLLNFSSKKQIKRLDTIIERVKLL